MKDDGKSYCPVCYGKMNLGNEGIKAAGEKREESRKGPGAAARSGFFNQHGVTVLRDADNLVECANCGWIITRDRLEKDARGRLRCPRCGKKFTTLPTGAPEKAKPEKTRREKPGTEDFALTAQLFKCLGDPCRVKIIESLSEKELCVFEFVEMTGYQYSALSYHLKTLREMGLIKSFERGNFMVYSLTDKGQIVHEFIDRSKGLK